jgi:nucleoside-diphosphate-sugar epimerase
LRIVVSGGTGFIGRALVMTLCERGDDVVVLSRGKPRDESCGLGARPTCCRGAGKVELATWTPEKAGDWSKVVDGADAVVHLAGAGGHDESLTPEPKEIQR